MLRYHVNICEYRCFLSFCRRHPSKKIEFIHLCRTFLLRTDSCLFNGAPQLFSCRLGRGLRPMNSNWIETHAETRKWCDQTHMTNRKGASPSLYQLQQKNRRFGLVLWSWWQSILFCKLALPTNETEKTSLETRWAWELKCVRRVILLECFNSCKPGFNSQDSG